MKRSHWAGTGMLIALILAGCGGGGGGDTAPPAAKSWRTATLLETGDGDAISPDVAFDAAGNALAVWSQNDGVYSSIYANRYVAGSGWTGEGLLETGDGDAAVPRIAFDGTCNAMAVWRQFDGPYTGIHANRYLAGVGWTGAVGIDPGTGNADEPVVALDADGNALPLWRQNDGLYQSIFVNRYAAGSGWTGAVAIDAGNENAFGPHVAFDADGNGMAVWFQFNGAYDSIYARRYVAGLGWTSAELLETGDGDAANPQVAFDGAGNATAVWRQFDGASDSIYANRYVAGFGWTVAVLLETDDGQAVNPRVACDASGNVVVVWNQYAGGHDNIYANRYVPGSGWTGPIDIDAGDLNADIPQVAFDSAGNAMAVWRQFDGAYDSIYANRYVPGSGWQGAGLVETGTGHAGSPRVALDASGNALAVWWQYDGAHFSIYAGRYE
jgi:hypothetical protein